MQPNFAVLFAVIAANACMVIAFIVFWIRNFSDTAPYWRVGLTFAAAIILLDVVVLAFVGPDALETLGWTLVFIDAMTALRLYVFTVVGLLLASRLNEYHALHSAETGVRQPAPRYGAPALTRESVSAALIAVLIFVVATVVLFRLTGAQPGATFDDVEEPTAKGLAIGTLVVVGVAFGEEIIFRLGLQNALTSWFGSDRYAHVQAVLVTTVFWAIMHIGAIDPTWVKMVQVSGMGLVLGEMNRRYGVLPCMLTHMLFNGIMVWLAPSMLSMS